MRRTNSRNSISTYSGKSLQKRKSPPREEVRQAYRKEPNSDWEEDCRCSFRHPLGGGVGHLKFEALREEVHCFDKSHHTLMTIISKSSCCSAAMHKTHSKKHPFRRIAPTARQAGTQNARTRRTLRQNSMYSIRERQLRGQRYGCRRGQYPGRSARDWSCGPARKRSADTSASCSRCVLRS